MAGFLRPAIVCGTLVLGVARGALAQDGERPAAFVDPPRAVSPADRPHVPVNEAIRLDQYLSQLDAWRAEGRISTAELVRARRLLHAAIVRQDPDARLPYDASGRIDLSALARGAEVSFATPTPRGERAVLRVLHEIDIQMRVTARDLAGSSNALLIGGAPGYSTIPARDAQRILKQVLELTPLNELPGGPVLASIVEVLPNTAGLDARRNVRELSRLIGDRQRDWLTSRTGVMGQSHKLETALLAFGAVTGVRAASPGAARFMDQLGLRLRIFRESTADTRLYSTGRLVYRNAYVLPELDLEGGARHSMGPVTLRATATGTVGVEAIERARGRLSFGARWERGNVFADTNAIYAFPENLARTEMRAGYVSEDGLALAGAVGGVFGRASGAVGRANGRLSYELDLSQAILLGRALGDLGVFIASGADSDFSNPEFRGGLIFRLRF